MQCLPSTLCCARVQECQRSGFGGQPRPPLIVSAKHKVVQFAVVCIDIQTCMMNHSTRSCLLHVGRYMYHLPGFMFWPTILAPWLTERNRPLQLLQLDSALSCASCNVLCFLLLVHATTCDASNMVYVACMQVLYQWVENLPQFPVAIAQQHLQPFSHIRLFSLMLQGARQIMNGLTSSQSFGTQCRPSSSRTLAG